jgi:YjjG family noncanonical pyrimidine nucleotidase
MKYKWLLFDADGTLFDYDKAEENALKNSFAQIGCPFEQHYLNEYIQINREIWLDFEKGKIDQAKLKRRRFELLFEALKIYGDPQDFSARYLANLAKETDLIDGAEETVKSLWENFSMAIITNGLMDVQRPRFQQSSIIKYIKTFIISEEVGAAKPNQKIFDIAFERMNNPPKSEVLIIGDGLTSDIQGGLNYGIDTCWFNPDGKTAGQPSSKFEIHRLDELPGILEVS